jgi:aryl-alcohol dehydrogenase-like predicted oxidoreductase
VDEIRNVLEALVQEGSIRAYGWSTDNPALLRRFAGQACATAQAHLNVLSDPPAMLAACDELDLALLCRSPLAMGLLTGKFDANSRLPRSAGWEWAERWFRDGRPVTEVLEVVAAAHEILTGGGRTPAQGALAWIWARGKHTIPIPGFKTSAQVEENVGALRFGPLTPGQVAEIDRLLRE